MSDWRPDLTGLCPHGRHLTAVCLKCGEEFYQPKIIIEDDVVVRPKYDEYAGVVQTETNDLCASAHELSEMFGGEVWDKNREESLSEKPLDDLYASGQHYVFDGFEAIDIIEQILTPEQFIGLLKGSILQYQFRANRKGMHDADCEKTEWYANRLVETLRKHNLNRTTDNLARNATES